MKYNHANITRLNVIWCLDKLRTMKITARNSKIHAVAYFVTWNLASLKINFENVRLFSFFPPCVVNSSSKKKESYFSINVAQEEISKNKSDWPFFDPIILFSKADERKKEARVSKLIENPGRHYAWHGCIKFLDAPAKIGGSMQCIRYKRRAVACLTCLLVLTRGHGFITTKSSNTSSCWINHRYSIEPFLIHLEISIHPVVYQICIPVSSSSIPMNPNVYMENLP